jgi:CheY-like chemotaxis protein
VALAGIRVFAVEDEALLLLTLEDVLAELGCQLVLSAQNLDDALAKADSDGFDIAVLDVNLAGRKIGPVAQRLATRGVPFVFVTGYSRSSLPEGLEDRPMVGKPYTVETLRAGLLSALEPRP